ncbi:hypothetical protein [Arthrobacter sp. TMS1-12-1]
MTTRLFLPLATLGISLGILALTAGWRDYPLLVIIPSALFLARLCFRPGGADGVRRAAKDPGTADPARFTMPPVDTCPPERLQEARDLAARVLDAAGPRQHRP